MKEDCIPQGHKDLVTLPPQQQSFEAGAGVSFESPLGELCAPSGCGGESSSYKKRKGLGESLAKSHNTVLESQAVMTMTSKVCVHGWRREDG